MSRYFLVVILMSLSSAAYSAGSSGWRTISMVQIEGSSYIALIPDTAWDNPDNCDNSARAMVQFTDPSHQAKLSLAISAYMGEKKLALWLSGCQSSSIGTIPVVYTMTIGD